MNSEEFEKVKDRMIYVKYEDKLQRPEVIEKTIKKFKEQLRYSKNPMEQRQIRSRLGKLELDLKLSREHYAREDAK